MLASILVWIGVYLLVGCPAARASVLQLFDHYHFYELTHQSEQPTNDFVQLFSGYKVVSDKCSVLHKHDFDKQKVIINDQLHLDTETLLYSNHEENIAFVQQFDLELNIKSSLKIVGIELEFEIPNRTDCVQILLPTLSSKQRTSSRTTKSNSFKIAIKDPVFLNQSHPSYFIHFGQVRARALVPCGTQTDSLCHMSVLHTSRLDMGIKSVGSNDFVNHNYMNENFCPDGQLASEVCIMRHSVDKSTNVSNYIIMQPMSKQFDEIRASTNVFGLLDYDDMEESSDNNVLLFNKRNMFSNGLAIKLIQTNSEIRYTAVLEKPNENNLCYDYNNKSKTVPYCKCHDECIPCYREDQHTADSSENNSEPKQKLYIAYVRNNFKCRHCDSPKFKGISFEQYKIITHFQNERLNKLRVVRKNSLTNTENHDTLPRLCIQHTSVQDEISNIRVVFNDYHLTAFSSLANLDIKYNVKMYHLKYNASLSMKDSVYDIDESRKPWTLEHRLVVNYTISPTQFIQVDNIKNGKYLIEVTQVSDNNACPGKCIDVTSNNNELQCVECPKLVGLYLLKHSIRVPGGNESVKSTTENSAPFNSQISKEPIKELDSLDEKTCPSDSDIFQDLSFWADDPVMPSERIKELIKTQTTVFYAGLVKQNYALVLPFMPLFNDEPEYSSSRQDGQDLRYQIDSNNYFVMITTFSVVLIALLFIILGLIILNLTQLPRDTRLIVFYLSILLNHKGQRALRLIVERYIKCIKAKFPMVQVEIIDYTTSANDRKLLMKQSSMIIYVCGTIKEVQRLNEPLVFGKREHHDDYNRIHYHPFKSKSIDVVFKLKSIPNCDESVLTAASVDDERALFIKSTISANSQTDNGICSAVSSRSSQTTISMHDTIIPCVRLPKEDKRLGELIVNMLYVEGNTCVSFLQDIKRSLSLYRFLCWNVFNKRVVSDLSVQNNIDFDQSPLIEKTIPQGVESKTEPTGVINQAQVHFDIA